MSNQKTDNRKKAAAETNDFSVHIKACISLSKEGTERLSVPTKTPSRCCLSRYPAPFSEVTEPPYKMGHWLSVRKEILLAIPSALSGSAGRPVRVLRLSLTKSLSS